MPTLEPSERIESAFVQLRGVSAGYGRVPIVHDVDMTVKKGETVVIIGPNGAGKSTLLKAICGVLPSAGGEITVGGESIANMRAESIARKGIGYVAQVRDVFTPLTVNENLELGGYGMPRSELRGRIEEMLDLFPQLKPMRSRMAGKLSGGEQKILAIARVLMKRPEVLLLDEPTTGLAPRLAHQLLQEEIRRLTDEGRSILMVEQRAQDALAVGSWAYVMVAGRVQVSDDAGQLRQREDIGKLFLGLEGPASSAANGAGGG